MQYQEQYQEALLSFQTAARLDDSSEMHDQQADDLRQTVRRHHAAVEGRGRLSKKQLASAMSKLAQHGHSFATIASLVAGRNADVQVQVLVVSTLTSAAYPQ